MTRDAQSAVVKKTKDCHRPSGSLAAPLFDHVSYACHKLWVDGWQLVQSADYTGASLPLEKNDSRAQALVTAATGYEFLWSRDATPTRLFQFHLDRPTYAPAEVCRGR